MFGAKERKSISKDNSYLLGLVNAIPKAWALYNQLEREDFEGLCRFFSHYRQNSMLLSWRYPVGEYERDLWQGSTNRDFRWPITQYQFGEGFLQSSHLDSVFTEREQHKLIKDLRFIPQESGIVQIRFQIQNAFRGALNRFINEIRKARYEAVCHESLDNNTNVMMQFVGIRARNSYFFKAYVNKKVKLWNGDKEAVEYDPDQKIYPWLQKMQELDLIRSLQRTANYRNTEIQFEFVGASNDTIRAMFDKTGTILELYAWHEALQQKCFYDIRSNFATKCSISRSAFRPTAKQRSSTRRTALQRKTCPKVLTVSKT